MTIYEKARLVAEKHHRFQEYGDGLPYIYHLDMVAEEVERLLPDDHEMKAAAYLHDILEDTSLSYNDIKTMFNDFIADIVYNVT